MRVGGLTFLVIGIVLALLGSLTPTTHMSAASKLSWIVLGPIFAGFGALLAARSASRRAGHSPGGLHAWLDDGQGEADGPSEIAGAQAMTDWMPSILGRTLVTATVLFLVEAFLLNQGVLVGLTALGAVLGGVPRSLLAWQRGDIATARLRIARTGIYVAVALLGIGTVVAQAYLARSRANTIIVAARQYEAQHGRLPDRLDELVPAFIASIPSTNYTLTFNKFMYLTPPGRHVLMWGMFQVGGRPYYDFENQRWGVFAD